MCVCTSIHAHEHAWCICMYVCMHICRGCQMKHISVCMYVCMYVGLYWNIDVNEWYFHPCTWTCIYTSCAHINIHIHICIHSYAHIHIHTFTHIHIHIYIHIHAYIHSLSYIYTYIHRRLLCRVLSKKTLKPLRAENLNNSAKNIPTRSVLDRKCSNAKCFR